jgi:hypothetical protein
MVNTDHSCKFPWTWLIINLEQDSWRFCCKTPWQEKFTHVYNRHHFILKKVKHEFLSGAKPIECQACWREEDLGGNSFRLAAGGATQKNSLSNYQKLEFIDIVFGSLCNLRCATCGPYSSSQWSAQLKKQKDIPYSWLKPIKNNAIDPNTLEKTIQIIMDNISTLSNLNIYGGESSIDPNFIRLLEYFSDIDILSVRSSPMRLVIITNGVWPDKEKISEKFLYNLRKIESKGWKVELKFSIDGVGKHAEFIRYPMKWNDLDRNLDMMVEEGFTDQINISTSLLNIPVKHEIIYYIAEKKYRDKIKPVINLVSTPSIFSISNLGNKLMPLIKPWNDIPNLPPWQFYRRWIIEMGEKQSQSLPNNNLLKGFVDYTKWYSDLNEINVPNDLKEYYNHYLD